MNLSFAGCGFLGIYHVGVAVCFRKYAPHLLLEKISGASAGAISACCMLCEMPLGEITTDVLNLVTEARAGSLGPFSPSFNVQNIIMDGLLKFLPDDAHIRVSGKLHISLTRVYDGKNVIVSQFNSREDLMQALLASCFIPVFSGMLPPRFHGVRYMDGGFSDNLPVLDENTITVSPFCGESDICPRDTSSQLFHINIANTSIELSKQNIGRFTRILFPPNPEVLSKMCKQGFDDALRFLHRNNLISCTRCLAVQSTFEIQEALDDSANYDPECLECKLHRQESMIANLPDTVTSVFQNAIDSTNNRFLSKVFKRKGGKLLSLLTLPYTVPTDIVCATFTKIMSYKPKVQFSLWAVWRMLLRQAHTVIYPSAEPQQSTSHRVHNSNRHIDLHNSKRKKSHVVSSLGNSSTMFPMLDEDLPIDDDTFEQVLRVTSQHEALMAYFYTDEHNQVKVTEIFDLTDTDVENIQSPMEREVNRQLEFDEWEDDQINFYENEMEDVPDSSMNDCMILSDPESEWNDTKSCDVTIKDVTDEDTSDKPESDQPLPEAASRPLQDVYQFCHHT